VLPKLQILKSHLELTAGPKYAHSIDLPFIASLLTWPGEDNKTFISFNESEVEHSPIILFKTLPKGAKFYICS
jgi:hypothetical protein